jgi:hypothetical protein
MRLPQDGDVLPVPLGTAVPHVCSARLFRTSTGQPLWHEHYGTRVFATAVERAKLPRAPPATTCGIATPRCCMAAGESVVAVAERLGHENGTLVLQVYGHLMPGSEDRTRKAVDAAWNVVLNASRQAVTAQGRPQ